MLVYFLLSDVWLPRKYDFISFFPKYSSDRFDFACYRHYVSKLIPLFQLKMNCDQWIANESAVIFC